jgi:pimeloyl-ACP methyl ester carboxylesterase
MRAFCWLVLLAWCSASVAAPTQIEYNGLMLNANLVAEGNHEGPIYLIVHGTWAHQEMEIIVALQTLLEENDRPSLAVTLSLGVSDRRGFLGCEDTVLANYESAAEEIDAWVRMLVEAGWRNIVIVGHSRGGAQVALYRTRYQLPQVRGLVLLAPALWHGDRVYPSYDARGQRTLDQVLQEARSTNAEFIGPYPLLGCAQAMARPSTFLSYYTTTVPKHTPDLLAQLDVPVQVFVGSNDRIAHWAEQDLASIGGLGHVRFVEIDGAGHFFRDLYLDDVVDEMLGDAP